MFEEKKKIICLMFKNTETFKRIAISYTLVPYVLISLSVQFLKNGCLFIMNCFFKKENKTDKWYEIVLKYLIVPILFGTVNPVKENSDKEYIFDIKYDERKSTKINRLDLCIYWTLISIINFFIMICISCLLKSIPITWPRGIPGVYYLLVVTHQLGYGIKWKTLLSQERITILSDSFPTVVVLFIIYSAMQTNSQGKIYFLQQILAIIYLLIIVMFILVNILMVIFKSIKDFKVATLSDKWKLILYDSFLSGLLILAIILIIQILLNNIKFKNFNITVGYSTYLGLVFGSVTVIGIFLNILSDTFFGKTLLYFVSKVSKNIFMLIGVRCFVLSIMLAFVLCPFYIVYNNYPYTDIITLTIYYILIFAILFLLIATGFLLVYFYQVVYAVKNYSEKGGSEFNNMTKWFAFVLAENIEKSDLQLDSYAQNHLVERLIELKSLTDLEIVEIFNNNSEFENQDSENTVILAIFKYLNKDTVPVFLNLQRNRIKNLSYADTSMKIELEMLQKKYGVYIADGVVENTMREKKKSIFYKIFLNFKIRENDI